MKKPISDLIEVQPGQEQKFLQLKQQQQQFSFWGFEAEFLQEDICHGGEIQNHMNPDVRDFMPGNKSSSAT